VDDKISLSEAAAALVALPEIVSRLEALSEQPTQAQQQNWMTVAQAAEYTGLSEDAIRSAVKAKALRRYTRGEKSISLRREDLDAYMGRASA
jgi:excisionase family DNA binding protein